MINFGGGNPGNSKPATFTAIKPNGMQWELTQEVIKYYKKKVINLVDMTGPENSEEAMKQQRINLQDQPVFPGLVKDMTG
ncbi:nucleoside diphosphate kinase b, partial [Lynx pardinus]